MASFCYIKDTGSTNTSSNFGPVVSTIKRSPAAKQCVIDRPVWFVHDLRTNQMASIDRENPRFKLKALTSGCNLHLPKSIPPQTPPPKLVWVRSFWDQIVCFMIHKGPKQLHCNCSQSFSQADIIGIVISSIGSCLHDAWGFLRAARTATCVTKQQNTWFVPLAA